MTANIHEPDSPRNGRVDDSKRDAEYVRDRFVWLDQVAADPTLPASAFKVAYVIATSLWRTKGTVTLVTPEISATDQIREAWVGTRDIADKIGMSRFTVMANVNLLEAKGHLEIDRGTQGRGHSNHYRLVRKGVHASLLDGAPAKRKTKTKGAPANLLDGEKVSHRTSRGAPTHLNPFVPFELPSEEERGAQQASPRRAPSEFKGSGKEPESLNKTPGAEIVPDDFHTGALGPPPRSIVVPIDVIPDGLILDENGFEYKPPPAHERRPPQKTWMDAAFEGYVGERP